MPKIRLKNETDHQVTMWAQSVVQVSLANREVYKLAVEFTGSVDAFEVHHLVTQSYASSVIASKHAGDEYYTFPVMDFLCVALCRVPPRDLRPQMQLFNAHYSGVTVAFEGMTRDNLALVDLEGSYICVSPLDLFPIL